MFVPQTLEDRMGDVLAPSSSLESRPRNEMGFKVRRSDKAEGERARDDDGTREVHDNTMEGLWNFPRALRGVRKEYMYQYMVMFERVYDVKRATTGFLWALLGVRSAT
jgi:hypothetical protein